MEGRLYGLDALRGTAALIVFASHTAALYDLPISIPAQARSVDLFFVLSGFVLARTYEHRMPPPARFIALRYRRLLPVAAMGTILGTAAVMLAGYDPVITATAGLALILFLPAPWASDPFLPNGPVWSLFAEIFANAAHALVLHRLPTAALVVLALVGMELYIPLLLENPAAGAPTTDALLPSLGRGMAGYLAGVITWRVWRDRPIGSPWAGLLAFPPAALGGQALGWVGAILFTFVAAPILLRSALGLGRHVAWTGLGLLSYPLYAVHFPILWFGAVAAWPPALVATFALGFAALLAWRLERRGSRLPVNPDRRSGVEVVAGGID